MKGGFWFLWWGAKSEMKERKKGKRSVSFLVGRNRKGGDSGCLSGFVKWVAGYVVLMGLLFGD